MSESELSESAVPFRASLKGWVFSPGIGLPQADRTLHYRYFLFHIFLIFSVLLIPAVMYGSLDPAALFSFAFAYWKIMAGVLVPGFAYLRSNPRWVWIPALLFGGYGLAAGLAGLANLGDRHGAGILIGAAAIPGILLALPAFRFLQLASRRTRSLP